MTRSPGSAVAAITLALSAGILLGDAILGRKLLEALMSAAQLGVGTALACALVRDTEQLPPELLAELRGRAAYEAAVQSAPRIGELLVYRYRWISEQDLARALAQQQHNRRLLGEILVRGRAVSSARLLTALVEQRKEMGQLPAEPLPEGGWTGKRERRERV